MRTVVFILRGCPVGVLGAYGNEWIGTPHLDRLAAESVVFDRHISDRPDPVAATRAWLGGDAATGSVLVTTLATAGVHTILIRANHPDTDGPEEFYAGWAEVFDARPQAEDASPLDNFLRTFPALLDRLADVPKFLLWVEIDRLLPPWDVRQDVFDAYFADEPEEPEEGVVAETDDEDAEDEDDEGAESQDEGERDDEQEKEPEGAAEPLPERVTVPPWSDPPTGPLDTTDPDAWDWLHDTFAAVLTTLDAELGTAFDEMRSRGLDRSATWVVTSDFGYPLGEHAQIGVHRPWLHEELVHTPLMVRLPNADEACRRVAAFTQPPDLFPTLLDLFGMKPPEGASLLPLLRGECTPHRTQAVTHLDLKGAAEAAIRTEGWALLLPLAVPEGETREPLLFEKPDDIWEVNDLRARNVDRADELEAELRKSGGQIT